MKSHPTRLSQLIKAPPSSVYQALINADDVQQWQVPDGMTSYVHSYEAKEGGQFRISLTYDKGDGLGKTDSQTDTQHGHFVSLTPNKQVVQVLEFETSDPELKGEMKITFNLAATKDGTELQAIHEGLPSGVRPEDNETGWKMALEKLAHLVENKKG